MRVGITIAVALFGLGCDHHHEHAEEQHAHEDHAAAASPPASPTELPEGVNAVQNEMRLLHEAMQGSVTAIANDDLGAIPEALHRVHQARGMTEAALENGSYRPPRNADRLDAFVALDEAFHSELERLVGAASANDSAATATQLGAVMSQCNGCHSQFRPEQATPERAEHDHHAH